MNDLRPYACTAEDCSQPDETYSTVKDYLRHEILFHEVPNPVDDFATRAGKSITCLFCGQQTTEGRGQHSRGRHVGQHMEEIAFTVVPKAYEDWEFYSEASSGKQTDKYTGHCGSQYPPFMSSTALSSLTQMSQTSDQSFYPTFHGFNLQGNDAVAIMGGSTGMGKQQRVTNVHGRQNSGRVSYGTEGDVEK